ncbi:MAG: hypothetical protein JSR91_22195 [Proteobacteria bacterium]|nr:hypothetical protein [Pseudomonadota bacterium]
MAFALARSFLYWNRDRDIDFHLVTDLDVDLPRDLSGIKVRRLARGELGIGFSPKLHLDRLAPADQTLFIDADCLCLGPLADVFDRFAGHGVSVFGEEVSTGHWFGDIEPLCARFAVPALPCFNGGVYYVEPGEKAAALYARARELEPHYDTIGLVRLRGRPNDEILVSIAMAEFRQVAIPDDGTVFACLEHYPLIHDLSVLDGICRMSNPARPHRLHDPKRPVGHAAPRRIAHFLNSYTDHWRYRTEILKLRLILAGRMPEILARSLAATSVALPGWSAEFAKDALRPMYRRMFGVRPIAPSKRI